MFLEMGEGWPGPRLFYLRLSPHAQLFQKRHTEVCGFPRREAEKDGYLDLWGMWRRDPLGIRGGNSGLCICVTSVHLSVLRVALSTFSRGRQRLLEGGYLVQPH